LVIDCSLFRFGLELPGIEEIFADKPFDLVLVAHEKVTPTHVDKTIVFLAVWTHSKVVIEPLFGSFVSGISHFTVLLLLLVAVHLDAGENASRI
jgi:hypothetical protein